MGKLPQVSRTRWSLATAVLATLGLHLLSFSGGTLPECIGCQSLLTLIHILLDCVDFLNPRQQFYAAGNMHDLFSKVKQEEI